jgi:hypothetical protein
MGHPARQTTMNNRLSARALQDPVVVEELANRGEVPGAERREEPPRATYKIATALAGEPTPPVRLSGTDTKRNS